MNTTAQLRKAAAEAAVSLDFQAAAELIAQAIAVYPCTGALAERDLAALRNCREEYLKMVELMAA